MLKKVVIGVVLTSISVSVAGGIIGFKYLKSSNNEFYNSILDIFNNEDTNSKITDMDVNFKPKEIESKLEYVEPPLKSNVISLYCKNDIIFVPVYCDMLSTNYNDMVFSNSGDFYISLIDNDGYVNNEFIVDKVELGNKEPVILKISIPNMTSTLYIQCYTSEAFSFFNNIDWSSIDYKISDIDLTSNYLELSSKIDLDSMMSDKGYLNNDIINLINNSGSSEEGHRVLVDYNNGFYCYQRILGSTYDRLSSEIYKFKELGYSIYEVGEYQGLLYFKTKDITVVVKSVTNNSCIIYFI